MEENTNQSLSEASTEVAKEVTDELSAGELIKLQAGISKNIIESLEGKRYDGESVNYRRWVRAVFSALGSIGFNNIESRVKDDLCETIPEEAWNLIVSKSDRSFIHRVVTDTLTPTTVDIVERADMNGVLLIRRFYKLWGAPSLANTITALNDLLNTRVARHDDPSPAFKKVERLFNDFFPDSGDNMKIAVLFKILDDIKYKTVLDTLEQKDTMPTYIELKDSLLTFFYRKQAEYKAFMADKSKQNYNGANTRAFNTMEIQNQGSIAAKRKRFCKKCKEWTTEHSTFNCPNTRGTNIQFRREHNVNHGTGKYIRRMPLHASGRGSKREDKKHIKCFQCGRYGHYSSECKSGSSMQPSSAGVKENPSAITFGDDN